MKTLKLAVLAIALALVPMLAQAQQFTVTQTTLNSDITPSQTTFILGSVTNITATGAGINNPVGGTSAGIGNITDIYIDRELMQVVSVNTTTKSVSVLRGVSGTQGSGHKASTMVLAAPPQAFQNFDPEGSCVVAQIPAQPTINTRTGAQWLCSTVTLTWVPGFTNGVNSALPLTVTAAVASAAGVIVPSGPLFHVTGTLAITGFTIPVGCNATVRGGCQFSIIPDGIFTWTAAGNISLAGTAVVNKLLTFTWDATASKWVPSYIA